MSEQRDRILDWRTELDRLRPELHLLPPAARRLVLELAERFRREDEAAPQPDRAAA